MFEWDQESEVVTTLIARLGNALQSNSDKDEVIAALRAELARANRIIHQLSTQAGTGEAA